MTYVFLADLVLISHFLYVLFVVAGLALVWTGKFLKWKWVQNPWFRFAHLASIAFVALMSLLGIPCPLTILEGNLRIAGGGDIYNQSFIEYWLHRILFFDAPQSVFTLIYIVFAVVVAGSFYFVPVRFSSSLTAKRPENKK